MFLTKKCNNHVPKGSWEESSMEPVNHWKQPKFLRGPVENVREAHPWADLLASKNQKKRYPKSSISSMGTYRVYGLASIPDLYCSINSTGPSSKKRGKGEKLSHLPQKKPATFFGGPHHRMTAPKSAWSICHGKNVGHPNPSHLKALVVRGCPKRRASWKFTNSMEV